VTTQQKIDRDGESSGTARAESSVEEARDRLVGLLPDDALQDALMGLEPEDITGPGGLLTQLAGRVVETALGAELSEHLGYPPGQAPPGGAGNHRNGSTPKTLRRFTAAFERLGADDRPQVRSRPRPASVCSALCGQPKSRVVELHRASGPGQRVGNRGCP
jgi:hypothetical protein